jgi:ribosomal protein L5
MFRNVLLKKKKIYDFLKTLINILIKKIKLKKIWNVLETFCLEGKKEK